ncbi:MAG: ketopantoate reductase [Rhodospirillales bacterium]|jgi:2-dehydropantoate 2-reductase|nr:ketopantoate reductase [Rhodospirillales bacterium]
MKVCIFGSGATGGYLGVELARAGAEVSLVARGAHLEAIRRNGLKLLIDGEERVAHAPATDDPKELGPQDYVIIGLKAHSIPGAVDKIAPLLGNDTAVVTASNGIPYWYFHDHGGPFRNTVLQTVDPDGKQWQVLKPERAIGCIVYPATEVVEPGVVKHVYGNKFPLGEPSGERTERVERLAALMTEAGLDAPVLDRIHDEIWLKLWGNLCFNPISALTHATLDVIASDPGTRAVAKAMMTEAQQIAEAFGVRFRVDIERRINGAGRVGAHKTSMLQDLERGRPMEIDALVAVIQEMGQLTGVATPTIDTVLALVRQRAKVAGLN